MFSQCCSVDVMVVHEISCLFSTFSEMDITGIVNGYCLQLMISNGSHTGSGSGGRTVIRPVVESVGSKDCSENEAYASP